jgi:hypothetical protein
MTPDAQDLTDRLYSIIAAQAAALEISYQTGYADGQASTREPERVLRLVGGES